MAVSDWLPDSVGALAVERKLEAGQHLFRLGGRTAGFYEILRGKIRMVRVDRAGRETVLHVAGAGETFAEASLFSATYRCDAVALTKAAVRLYPKAVVLAEFARDTKSAQAFMATLAHQVMTLRTRLEQRNIRAARDRVRHYLSLNVGADEHVTVEGTLKELATELGLTHEALYRTLADMEADGEIERHKTRIRFVPGAA